jgi:hypothetical protein
VQKLDEIERNTKGAISQKLLPLDPKGPEIDDEAGE